MPAQDISRAILVLRGQRVILDAELAAIYGVTEHAALISQFAMSKPGRGGRRKLPWAFTEHGAIQAADKHDDAIAAIRQLMNAPAPKRRGIGFTADIDDKS